MCFQGGDLETNECGGIHGIIRGTTASFTLFRDRGGAKAALRHFDRISASLLPTIPNPKASLRERILTWTC